MKTNNQHWLDLIVHEKFSKELRRNTSHFNSKPVDDKTKRHQPVHGGFTEYGNLIARRLGIS
jgi:hypothetical protein